MKFNHLRLVSTNNVEKELVAKKTNELREKIATVLKIRQEFRFRFFHHNLKCYWAALGKVEIVTSENTYIFHCFVFISANNFG